MIKFTLLEIHVDDSDFEATASAPCSSGEKEVEAGGEPPEPGEGSRKGAAVAALVGLVFLAAVAYLARSRYPGNDGNDEFEFDE